jgi:hypothetical protein
MSFAAPGPCEELSLAFSGQRKHPAVPIGDTQNSGGGKTAA